MDILDLIRKKSKVLQAHTKFIGLDAVITHIETAEKYLSRGKEDKDETFYTDVIYRTNHAFEGILKEAYTVLTTKIDSKITPYEVENYLANNNILRQRVMDLFSNYRQQWRNPSTHDHQLFFTEQEAFLAIVSVSAFVNILIDQMIEQVNFKLEQERIRNLVPEIKAKIDKYAAHKLLDRVTQLLLAFSDELIGSASPIPTNEAEAIGMLSGFVSSIDKNIHASHQPLRMGTRFLEPDLVFTVGEEYLLLELKIAAPTKSSIIRAEKQLLSYLRVLPDIAIGILFFLPMEKDVSMVTKEIALDLDEAGSHLTIIYPQKKQMG